MKALRPQIIMEGILFDLDYPNRQIIEVSNPENTTKFSELKQDDTYYTLVLDERTSQKIHTVFENINYSAEANINNDINALPFFGRLVKIPKVLLDELPFLEEEEIPNINTVCHRDELGFVMVDEAIRQRLSGKLPTLEINGESYFVNVRLKQLEPKNLNHSPIKIREEFEVRTSYALQFFMNTKTKQLVEVDLNSDVAPKDIVFVRIPSLVSLDPIGINRMAGQSGLKLLNDERVFSHYHADTFLLTDANYRNVLNNYRKIDFRTELACAQRNANAFDYREKIKLGQLIFGSSIYGINPKKAFIFQVDRPHNRFSYKNCEIVNGFLHIGVYPDHSIRYLAMEDRKYQSPNSIIRIPENLLFNNKRFYLDSLDILNDIARDRKYNFQAVDQAILDRLNGKLPTFYIKGEPFTVDAALKRLVSKTDCSRIIPYKKSNYSNRNIYSLLDPSNNRLIEYDREAVNLDLGLQVITIPDLLEIDPAVNSFSHPCRALINVRGLLNNPLEMERHAEIHPVQDSVCLKVINDNRKFRGLPPLGSAERKDNAKRKGNRNNL